VEVTASCPTGKRAISGGVQPLTDTNANYLISNAPVGTPPTAWHGSANIGAGDRTLTVFAICASVTP
jgi:hypothetical protein